MHDHMFNLGAIWHPIKLCAFILTDAQAHSQNTQIKAFELLHSNA